MPETFSKSGQSLLKTTKILQTVEHAIKQSDHEEITYTAQADTAINSNKKD